MSEYLWRQLRNATKAGSGARAAKLLQAIASIVDGRVRVGRRRPVDDMPVWVTPTIVRGGFATGAAEASGPLQDDERELAGRFGIPADRASLFDWALSDGGLSYLADTLDRRTYRLELPEHGALLTIAYLLREGHEEAAIDLIELLRPWAGDLRLLPVRVDGVEPEGVHVSTLGQVAGRLEQKKPSRQIEAQREAYAVWIPFNDRLVELWWATRDGSGAIGGDFPDGWPERARALIEEYRLLAAKHTLTTKHARPGSSTQILLASAQSVIDGSRGDIGRAQRAVAAITAKRGVPGSADGLALRADRRREASRPSYATLAQNAARTLRAHDGAFLAEPTALIDGQPGADLPFIRNAVDRAAHAPLPELLGRGIVRSAEMLADLAPQVAAESVAARYADVVAGRLAAALHIAFANRRSLLLLNYESQVDVHELPWFAALEKAGAGEDDADASVRQALALAGLAVEHFPGTVLPNPFLRELQHLFRQAQRDVPLTYELAADIFMGGFTESFARAGETAARVVGGGLYARYYGLGDTATTAGEFSERAHERAGVRDTDPRERLVARNGRVIEQAQVLTTHNLAVLTELGMTVDGTEAARGAWTTVLRELAAARGPHGLRNRKNAAYAWRQVVFHLTMAGDHATDAFIAEATGASAGSVSAEAGELIDGLVRARQGEAAQPFYGWTTG